MRRRWALLQSLLLALLAGCSSLQPSDFRGGTPAFDPVAYFEGETVSWGVFENRHGEPVRRFSARLTGVREGDTLHLVQRFEFEDGSRQERRWRMRRIDAHRFEATADGVTGVTQGVAQGNAFRWDYLLQVDPDNRLSRVHMHHWMYLAGDGRTLINRVRITKLGLRVSDVTEYFQRGAAAVPSIRAGK